MRVSTYIQLIVIYTLLLLAMYVNPFTPEYSDFMEVVLFMATFVFAILLGFTISNRHKRFLEIRNLLRNDDATIVNIYKSSAIFGSKIQEEIQLALDDYLITQIDYKLTDYVKSRYHLDPLYKIILSINPKGSKEDLILDRILSDFSDITHTHRKMAYWLGDRIHRLEWLSISILYVIIVGLIVYLSSNNIISYIVVPIIGTTLFMPIVVLRHLNNLTWQNQDWDWKPLTLLFKDLSLDPYYFDGSITISTNKFLKENGIKKYRLVEYKDKYPIFKNKRVTLVKLK